MQATVDNRPRMFRPARAMSLEELATATGSAARRAPRLS